MPASFGALPEEFAGGARCPDHFDVRTSAAACERFTLDIPPGSDRAETPIARTSAPGRLLLPTAETRHDHPPPLLG